MDYPYFNTKISRGQVVGGQGQGEAAAAKWREPGNEERHDRRARGRVALRELDAAGFGSEAEETLRGAAAHLEMAAAEGAEAGVAATVELGEATDLPDEAHLQEQQEN